LSKQPKTLLAKYSAIQEIGTSVEIPWHVARLTEPRGSLKISGNQLCIGNYDADYGSIEECRAAIAWYVEQLGGKVKWQK